MGSAPQTNLLNQWQHPSAILSQQILDRSRNSALQSALHDSVAHKFAEFKPVNDVSERFSVLSGTNVGSIRERVAGSGVTCSRERRYNLLELGFG